MREDPDRASHGFVDYLWVVVAPTRARAVGGKEALIGIIGNRGDLPASSNVGSSRRLNHGCFQASSTAGAIVSPLKPS
jgi:hypothetical protein